MTVASIDELRLTSCDLPLSGQRVAVTPARYDWVYMVLAGIPGHECAVFEETLWLRYRTGLDPEFLRSLPVAAWLGAGGVLARAGVSRREDLTGVVLPQRPGLRLVAMAMASARPGSLASAGRR